MGFGDWIIGSGLAKGAKKRGKRIAFGDGHRILWSAGAQEVLRNNPNIAPPGSEGKNDIEWHPFRKGNRIYNSNDPSNGRWIWNYDFKPIPGEFYFEPQEIPSIEPGFILIEPNVPWNKTVAPNKDWGFSKYQAVADLLRRDGFRVAQFSGGKRLDGAEEIKTETFRQAAAALTKAALYIGPEGGLHHAAAAVNKNAVVLFGGFIPPKVTGYSTHTNLTGGAEACGRYHPCKHCREALDRITVEEVHAAATSHLQLVLGR